MNLSLAFALMLAASPVMAQDGPCIFGGHWIWGVGCTYLVEPSNRSWHLLTQSYGGTVSLIKDLTKDECEKAKAIFVVPPCAAVNGSYTTCLSQQPIVGDGDIKSAECFQ